MNKSFVWGIILILALVIGISFASAQTCMISEGIGKALLPDTDCDRIVDIQDNCPFITNPMQRDYDGNGLGDACDLYVESISTSPSDFESSYVRSNA
jgi:hypothetical protein